MIFQVMSLWMTFSAAKVCPRPVYHKMQHTSLIKLNIMKGNPV